MKWKKKVSEKDNRIPILSQDNLKIEGERDDLKNEVKQLKITNQNNLKEFRKLGEERDTLFSRIDALVEENDRESERKAEEAKLRETKKDTMKKKTDIHTSLTLRKIPI